MLLPHLFLVQLLVWLPTPSSSNSLDPQVLQSDEGPAPNCINGSLPYPFGLANNTNGSFARPGFEIFCDAYNQPQLLIGRQYYKLLNISQFNITQHEIRIAAGSFASVDAPETSASANFHAQVAGKQNSSRLNVPTIGHPNSTRVQPSPRTPPSTPPVHGFQLEGTPYTFSYTRNKFTAIGCDAMALLHGQKGSTWDHNYTSGCVSFCLSMDDIINGSCSGVGCCQASLHKGLKNIRLLFRSILNLTDSAPLNMSAGRCSRAFIVDKDWFSFSTSDIQGLYGDTFRPVVLDWAIGSDKCKEAQRRKNQTDGDEATQYACKGNTTCYDSPDGVGYRCRCNEGYDGNPYIGCSDIDECNDPDNSPCVRKCTNRVGGYDCACPFGMTGDGRRDGSGCKRIEPLEIALGVGLGLLIMFLVGGTWAYWGRRTRQLKQLKQKHFIQNGGLLLRQHISSREAIAKIFSSEELERATNNFNESRVLGRGGYGTVYKGVLSDQRVVAIKKSKMVDESQIEQFINEVVILSQTNHRNVVKLLGCCLETQVPLLVYEFISNGTLYDHVHNNNSEPPMSWENRLRIAVETAGALAYLHRIASIPIIHRDVKSTNILLNENLTAKVSDFGASRLVPYNHTHITTLVQGTLGYLDPEYFHTSQLTEKSDVYSFGVVLVEILTGEKPISMGRSEMERNLASHFSTLVKENRFLEVINPQTVKEVGVRHLHAVALLAKRCLSVKGEERPTMKEVVVELDALRRLLMQGLVQWNQREEFPLLQCRPHLLPNDRIQQDGNALELFKGRTNDPVQLDDHDDAVADSSRRNPNKADDLEALVSVPVVQSLFSG